MVSLETSGVCNDLWRKDKREMLWLESTVSDVYHKGRMGGGERKGSAQYFRASP